MTTKWITKKEKTEIVCDACDGECKSNETEKCDKCGVECRIGCANNPSDESIFNDLCDKCRDDEEGTQTEEEICPRCGDKWTEATRCDCPRPLINIYNYNIMYRDVINANSTRQ